MEFLLAQAEISLCTQASEESEQSSIDESKLEKPASQPTSKLDSRSAEWGALLVV